MKYYSEDEMKSIREAFEAEVLSWPDISTKKMFGCPCYQHKGKLFAFLVTKGIVITKLDDDSRTKLAEKYKVEPFSTGNRTVSKWPKVDINKRSELKKLMPFVKISYESVLVK